MSTRRPLISAAFALGAAVLVVGCQNDKMNDDNNMRNNNRSDSINTGTGSMQRSSNDSTSNRQMGVQTSERRNSMETDTNNGRTAADRSTASMRDMSSTTMTDDAFVKMAASSDMFEIESSRLAVERTKDASLKQFAQQMITDHTQTSTQLKDLASQKGWTVPTSMTAEHRQQLDMLKNAKGDAFDAMYRTSQMKAHAEAVAMFDTASQNASDPALKSWAGQTLPKLQMHADMMKGHGTGSHDHK